MTETLTRTRPHAHTTDKTPESINVLIACECSQVECKAWRALGFNAFSADIQRVRSTWNPEWHILGDVTPLLRGQTTFYTQDGNHHSVPQWHLIIAHPPCTYLCRLSACQLYKGGEINPDRYAKMQLAREFFFECLNAKCNWLAVENPVPLKIAELPQPTTYYCPSWFGVKYTKKTCLWLKNLPPVMPQILYPNPKSFVNRSRGKWRSRTFPQAAEAIARQWSAIIMEQ